MKCYIRKREKEEKKRFRAAMGGMGTQGRKRHQYGPRVSNLGQIYSEGNNERDK